jgi:hypothetical protein
VTSAGPTSAIPVATWHVTLASGETDRLAAELAERWKDNAPTRQPSGLPGQELTEDFGWSVALEAFLLSLPERSELTNELVKVFAAAMRLLPQDSFHDVWLADLLALRRAPPLQVTRIFGPRREEADLTTLRFILDQLPSVTKLLPAPDIEAYRYFTSIYDTLTTVLVSEIVEADHEYGPLATRYQAGARPIRADARSLLRSAVADRAMYDSWPSDPKRDERNRLLASTGDLIKDLVDGLCFLSQELEQIGLFGEDAPEHLLIQAEASPARYFDDSLYRLLAADPRPDPRHEVFRRALDLLHVRSGRPGPTAGLYVDVAEMPSRLWGSKSIEPELENLVCFNSKGKLVLGRSAAYAETLLAGADE